MLYGCIFKIVGLKICATTIISEISLSGKCYRHNFYIRLFMLYQG